MFYRIWQKNSNIIVIISFRKEGNIKPHLPMHEEATLHEEKLDAEKQITPQPITPKSNINLSQSNTTQSPGDHNTSPRSAIVKTPLSSVKALRNRWEVRFYNRVLRVAEF